MLKEGPAEDYNNREKVAGLLRFASTRGDGDAQTVSLADYLGRMSEGRTRSTTSPASYSRCATVRTWKCFARRAWKCCC